MQAPAGSVTFLEREAAWMRGVARLERMDVLTEAPAAEAGTIRQPVGAFEVHVPLAGLFDVAAERTRLSRELEKVRAELDGLGKRLSNPQFVDRAKPEVVAEARQKQADLQARAEKVETMLRSLGGA